MRKKVMLAKALSATRTLSLAGALWPSPRRELKVLAYHRVLDVADDDAFDFDVELISAGTADFDWQVRHVRDNYDPITFADLLAALDGRAALPSRPVIFTFDDGFDDNYEYAYPILRRHGVPATIFISSDYIGAARTYWFDWVSYLVNQCGGRRIELPGLGQSFDCPTARSGRRALIMDLLERLKRVPDAARRAAVDELEAASGVEFPAAGFAESRPMSWDQVREMADNGIEFGSHTASHPILKQVDDAGLERELGGCKQRIEAELGRACDVIAYPVGGAHAFDQRIIDHVGRAGYRLGASYQRGTNDIDALETFAMKRIHVEREVGREQFAAALALPALFA